jgi:hypothetical protein
MRQLGRRGGLLGGRARAGALTPARRSAIARRAAQARWSKRLLVPGQTADLASFVAHYGSAVASLPPPADLETLALRAVARSRRDSALARMLPVFMWRVRHELDLDRLVVVASRKGQAQELGFFLEAAARLGHSNTYDLALAQLRRSARGAKPRYFFHGTGTRPFERMAADVETPPLARQWGLLMNVGWDSFSSYFRKSARL